MLESHTDSACLMEYFVKRLIINADDFGYDTDTYAATAALLERGVIRSATILVNYPEAEAAMRFAKVHGKNCSFGLHFNIAEQSPLARDPVPSLVNASGQYRGAIVQRLRALLGLLNPSDIAREAEAQLGMLADYGVTPTHIDSHGHFHKFPPVLAALRPVLERFGITRVRRPQTLYDNPTFYNGLLDRHCNKRFHGVISTDHFFNTRSHDDGWFWRFLAMLPQGSTSELGIHPGYGEAWRRAEYQPFETDIVLDQLVQTGVSLISYHDV
jgi:chitin disaccharide deacetylase